jgi:hypothetical protein
MTYIVRTAINSDIKRTEEICAQIETSAKDRGTGIAKRSPAYICDKILEGKAVIATGEKGETAGFCYIESWGHNQYVANSGLIVFPAFRGQGLAMAIKKEAFRLSLTKFPGAKLFGLTTSLAVMKINSDIGYRPVTFSQLTQDEKFWAGCKGCVNYSILESKSFQNCLCTGMLLDPDAKWAQEIIERYLHEESSLSV